MDDAPICPNCGQVMEESECMRSSHSTFCDCMNGWYKCRTCMPGHNWTQSQVESGRMMEELVRRQGA